MKCWRGCFLLTLVLHGSLHAAKAAEKTDGDPPAGTGTTAAPTLADEQLQVARKFEDLKQSMLKMAEVTAATDPGRAALLRQAYGQIADRSVDTTLDGIVDTLKKDELYQASKDQAQVEQELQRLLELLLTADRDKADAEKKDRLNRVLREVNRLIKEQRSIQGQTEAQGAMEELEGRQTKLAERTAELHTELSKAEGSEKPALDSDEGAPKETTPGETPSEDDAPPSGEATPGAAEPSETPAEQSDGAPSDRPPSAAQRLQSVEGRMRAAQKNLEAAKRADAVQDQERAIEELEIAKAELERVLRQMREEAAERMLTMMEARFREMFELETQILEGTKRLDAIAEGDRDRDDEVEANRLSRKQSEVVLQADKAMTLMNEEGSAVAFSEAVGQMQHDMRQIVARLDQANVGAITQSLEEDVLTALEEMLASLKQAKKEQSQKRRSQPSSGGGEQEPSPLVDQISELKMVRALQMRVNNRTVEYAKMLAEGHVEATDLRRQLTELAERQSRIHRAVRDISTGRNR